jgi:hypothetical protein
VRGLTSAERRVKAFGRLTASIGLKMAAAGGALLGPLAGVFKEAAGRSADIGNLSDRTGVAADKLSALAYAAERGGVNFDEFAGTLDGFQGKLFAAADGSDEVFRRLNLNGRALAQMPLDQALGTVLDRVNALADPMDRAAVGTEIFGSQWQKLGNTAFKSRAALKALTDEAGRVGAVVSAEDAKRGQEVLRAFTATWQSLKYAVLEVGTALLPQSARLTDLAGLIRDVAGRVREWIAGNRGAVLAVAGVAAGLVAAGVALTVFGSAVGVVGSLLGGVVTVLGLVGSALSLLLTPAGLVVAAVAGLGYLFVTQTEQGGRWAGAIMEAFQGVGDFVKEVWGGITDAIGAGRFDLAAKIAFAAVKVAWAETVRTLTEVWNDFKGVFVDGWITASVAVVKVGVVIVSTLKQAFAEVAANLVQVLGDAISSLLQLAARVAGALGLDDIAGVINTLDGQVTALRDQGVGAARKFGREAADAEGVWLAAADEVEAEEKKRRAAERAADVDAATAEVDRARDELAGLRAEAADAAAKARQGAAQPPKDVEAAWMAFASESVKGMLAALPTGSQLALAAKGTFAGSNLAGSLGYGDSVGQRQLRTTEQLRDIAARTNTILEDKLGVLAYQ